MTDAENEGLSGLQTVALFTLVALFSIPSLLLNITAHESATNGARQALNIATVFAAPLCMHSAISYAHQRRALCAIIGGCVFAIVSGYNLTTALGNVAKARTSATEARQGTMVSVARLEEERTTASKQRAAQWEIAKGYTSALASQEMTTYKRDKLWLRSNECTNATMQDSIDLCALYGSAEKRWLAAKEAERLDLVIADLDSRLSAQGPAPAVADPQVADVTALANLFMPVDAGMTSVLLNVYAAVIAELLGAFSPLFLSPLFAGRRRKRPDRVPPQKEAEMPKEAPKRGEVVSVHVSPPGPKSPATQKAIETLVVAAAEKLKELPPPDAVERFLAAHTRAKEGETVASADLHAAYVEFCGRMGRVPLSIHKFSPAVERHGFTKIKGRRAVFHGLELITT